MVQNDDGQNGGDLAAVVVGDRERYGLVSWDIPSDNRVGCTAGDLGEIVASGRRSGSNSYTVRERPIVGQNLTVFVNEDIGEHQICVGHGGHLFSKDLHGDPVVDVNLDGFHACVDAV